MNFTDPATGRSKYIDRLVSSSRQYAHAPKQGRWVYGGSCTSTASTNTRLVCSPPPVHAQQRIANREDRKLAIELDDLRDVRPAALMLLLRTCTFWLLLLLLATAAAAVAAAASAADLPRIYAQMHPSTFDSTM